MKQSKELTIKELHTNYVHRNSYLRLKIISTPQCTGSTVHMIVQDKDKHSLRLSVDNWSLVLNTLIFTPPYIIYRTKILLPIGSHIVLLDPRLIQSEDEQIALQCVSPNTHLVLYDFQSRCTNYMRVDIDQLIRWGHTSYQVGDTHAAIKFYTDGLKQVDEKPEEDFFWKEYLADEYEPCRIPLLYNRAVCYLKERCTVLALADLKILCSLPYVPQEITGSIVRLCAIVLAQLGRSTAARRLTNMDLYCDRYSTMQLELGILRSEYENNADPYDLQRRFLKHEINRIEQESIFIGYDVRIMLRKLALLQLHENNLSTFFDLGHFHCEHTRNDLYEIRPYSVSQRIPNSSL